MKIETDQEVGNLLPLLSKILMPAKASALVGDQVYEEALSPTLILFKLSL